MREIRSRLRQIAKDLKQIIPYSIAYLEDLIKRYRGHFPRHTEIVSFQKVDVREAARRDLKLSYDRESGYLGHQIQGKKIADVSHYDRVLVIRKDATFSVVDAPDKLFVGKGMLFCGLVDKEQVFNLLFRDKDGKYFRVGEDLAAMLPMLEMSGTDKARHIPEPLMWYNCANPAGAAKTWPEATRNTARLIRGRRPYTPLDPRAGRSDDAGNRRP